MIKLNYGPRLLRFAMRPLELDRRLNILSGSVRSGKTWAMHPKIMAGCRYPVAGWRVLTGVTKETVYNNVLNDLFDLVGKRNYNYNHQSGLLRLFNSRWRVVGAKDEGSEKFIRGITVGLAVCDEVTLMPPDFFRMLNTRLSPEGARLYGTTNTDSPLHYLKTEFLDNEELRSAGDLFQMHCTMDDNPNLTEEYKASQKRFFKGLFYLRFIEGLWVMAEGLIYRDVWDEKRNTFDDADIPVGLFGAGGTKERTVTIDYGTTNPFVAQDWRDDGTTAWCVDEYRWDSEKEMAQKTDKEYAEALDKFLKGDHSPRIVIDPSAASMKQELIRHGFWVGDAVNDVQLGIQKTSSALARGMLRFHRRKCRSTIGEFQVYSWDKKKALRGIEEPLKQQDHGPDATRYYAATVIPSWRLM